MVIETETKPEDPSPLLLTSWAMQYIELDNIFNFLRFIQLSATCYLRKHNSELFTFNKVKYSKQDHTVERIRQS